MPWIKQEDCLGCGTCATECSVNAIVLEDMKARINMDVCIRCGRCHTICPQEAVRHDSEKIPSEVEANIDKTRAMMRHFESMEEKRRFLGRMVKHFNKEKIVAEKSIERVKEIIAGLSP